MHGLCEVFTMHCRINMHLGAKLEQHTFSSIQTLQCCSTENPKD
uniref:Uncharacterized protein n=1 Tax=Anguilla anguilla TaxID=7936 RepID=A0A0E9XHC3_ANGAN